MFLPTRKPEDLLTRVPSRPRCALTRLAASHLAPDPATQRRLAQTQAQYAASGMADFWFDADARACPPARVMPALRFGGQFVFITRWARQAAQVQRLFAAAPEFVIERPASPLPCGRLARALHQTPTLVIARKVLLDHPDRLLSRQSFDVRLAPGPTPGGWVVSKRIPDIAHTRDRLARLAPRRDADQTELLARKLTDTVFPILLTRETGFLRLLQERLPPPLRDRVPEALRVERDAHGRVRRLDMTWLREGGPPITPTAFARQAATLLDALHRLARVVHLDLRLDNMVVTDAGVGFVDFGSACLIGEAIEDKRVVGSLFNSMLSASRIRRDLRRLRRKALVTSSLFDRCYPNRDPAIDLFALALQMTRPTANPVFRGLVTEPGSESEQDRLTRLQRHVLRPRDPARPYLTDAGQIAQLLGATPTEADAIAEEHRPALLRA